MDGLNQWDNISGNATEKVDQAARTLDEAARRTVEFTTKAAQTKPAQTMRDASNRVEAAVSDEPVNTLWRSMWLGAAGAAVLASLGLLIVNRKHESLFIGQWVPTLAIVALWGQVVKEA